MLIALGGWEALVFGFPLLAALAAFVALYKVGQRNAWKITAEAWKSQLDAAVLEAERANRTLAHEREEKRALRLEVQHYAKRTDLTPLMEKQAETQEALVKFIDSNAKATRALVRTMGEVARALKVQTDENGNGDT